MQELLAQFIAISCIGVLLYMAYALYWKLKDKIKSWKLFLCMALFCYVLPYITVPFIPTESTLSSCIFAVSYIMGFLLFFAMLFSYSDNKKENKEKRED